MQLYDILRSLITNAMLIALLFTLARPKYRWRTLWAILAAIVTLDLALNIFFYLQNDYTTLAKLDIVFFILTGIATKSLFQETIMPWLFNCFTVMNVYAVTVILSYYFCGLFPHPYYAIIVLRALLFAAAIALFRRRLRPLYRQAAEHWSVYLFVAVGLFMNFTWYFMAGDNVERMLRTNFVSLLLLVLLAVLVYMAIFLSLRKALQESALREENLKIQSDRELMHQRLILMDESVRQMSIAQHDRRHFNNTLLTLLQQGETDKATNFIQQQSKALPQKPQSYCQNISVNAAVSYYAELACQKGIRCDLRLDVPAKIAVDELSLAMTVSNLMENAIAAVSILPAQRREMRFTIVNAGQLILELSNPYDGEIEWNENGLPISRKEGHGKGCQSVANFTAKCGGELMYEVSGGVFKVRMMV